jgi:ATP-dependent Clp protease ATP-binding subunit ClpA
LAGLPLSCCHAHGPFYCEDAGGLQESQTLASSLQHQEIMPEHLLLSLLRQPEGLVRPLLEKLEVSSRSIEEQLEGDLAKRPNARRRANGGCRAEMH